MNIVRYYHVIKFELKKESWFDYSTLKFTCQADKTSMKRAIINHSVIKLPTSKCNKNVHRKYNSTWCCSKLNQIHRTIIMTSNLIKFKFYIVRSFLPGHVDLIEFVKVEVTLKMKVLSSRGEFLALSPSSHGICWGVRLWTEFWIYFILKYDESTSQFVLSHNHDIYDTF